MADDVTHNISFVAKYFIFYKVWEKIFLHKKMKSCVSLIHNFCFNLLEH